EGCKQVITRRRSWGPGAETTHELSGLTSILVQVGHVRASLKPLSRLFVFPRGQRRRSARSQWAVSNIVCDGVLPRHCVSPWRQCALHVRSVEAPCARVQSRAPGSGCARQLGQVAGIAREDMLVTAESFACTPELSGGTLHF